MATNEPTKRRAPLPSEYMKARRPHLFPDTEVDVQPVLSKEVLDYHLETLTNRKQETEFEYFARLLAEQTIAPNLRPQTGPTGGGDAKVDSETYTVSDEVAQRWYVGEQAAGRERWAFAFSAKKDWKPKVRDDVSSILTTSRDYSRIYFITNQYARDKDRAALEDELTGKAGVPVTILDRSWIMKEVFDRKLFKLTTGALGMDTQETRTKKAGPRDTERQTELEQLDNQIADTTRYNGTPYALAEDALRAALLARGLGRPRAELDGRFAQAKRIAKQSGFKQQEARVAYNHAWTTYFWFDDFREFLSLFDEVESHIGESENSAELDNLVTLFSITRSAVGNGYITAEESDIAARRARLTAALERSVTDQARPANASEAKTNLLLIRIGETAFESDGLSKLDQIWSEFRDLLREAKGLASFDIERVFDMISELGGHVPESAAFDAFFEDLVEIVEERKSEGEGGKAYVQRAFQKLRKGHFYDAIRYFGRATDRFFGNEYGSELAMALIGSSLAYDEAGLRWAARNYALAAANHGVAAFERHGTIGPYAWRPLARLAETELKLGRVPQFLMAYEFLMILKSQVAIHEEQQAALADERMSYAMVLGSLLLATRFEDLPFITQCPDLFERLGLGSARIALLLALGHGDTLREEGSIPPSESREDLDKILEEWGRARKANDLPEAPIFSASENAELSSIILGVKFTISSANNPAALTIAESVLGALESLLSTSVDHRMLPRVDHFKIALRQLPDQAGMPKLSIEESVTSAHAVITHGPTLDFNSRADLEAYPKWLSEAVITLGARAFSIDEAEKWADQILGEERAYARAITFSNIPLITQRVFGADPKVKLTSWIDDTDTTYPLRREEDPRPGKTAPQAAPLQMGEGEPPEEPLDFSRVRHSDMRVVSLIDTESWNRAQWSGTFFMYTDSPAHPPVLGLMFQDAPAARRIFEGLRERLGRVDESRALRVTIVRGISAANPTHYAVIVGSSLSSEAAAITSGQRLMYVSRINRMTPDSDANLRGFLDIYRRAGRYLLVPAIVRAGGTAADPLMNIAIGKYELEVRNAWEIGMNDPDIVVLDPDDPPVIPAVVIEPPVIEALKFARSRRRGER